MLAATAQAPGLARQATHEALAAWQVAHLEETALLLVSELVTNAVRHARTGGTAVVLRLETAGSWLRVRAPRRPGRQVGGSRGHDRQGRVGGTGHAAGCPAGGLTGPTAADLDQR